MCIQYGEASLKGWISSGFEVLCLTALALLWGSASGSLWAQDTNTPAQNATATSAPAPQSNGGLQIRSVSAYAVYDSSFVPNSSSFLQTTSANLPFDVGVGGSILFDWTRFTERSSFSLTYTPSYTGYVRDSSLNALNHALSLTTSRKIAPRWNFGFSLAGNLSTLEQSLFSSTALSNVAAVPSTFGELTAGLLSANFTNNPQLGAALTSAPLVESPVSNLIYGQRMLTSSAHVSLSYSYSPRLSVTFSGGGGRTQYLSEPALGTSNTSVISNTTSGNAQVALSYSLSPFSTLGGSVTTTRTSSSLYDAYTTTSQATLGRTLGMRWFMQVHGGIGITNAVREITFVTPTNSFVPAKPAPVIGGSLGYKTLSDTFIGSYDRTVVDSYGLGASTTSSANATWRWRRPGSSWWLESSFGWQQLQGGALANTSGWRTTVGLNRAVGTHAVLLTQYVYMDYSGGLLASTSHFSQSAVRVSIAWTPHPALQ